MKAVVYNIWYYLDNDTEYYLSKDKRIYIGSKNRILKGTYEVLEFKLDYLSEPVINYTLDGEEKEGNIGGISYYNDTSLYIKDKNNIEINDCSKYGFHCFRRNNDDYFKKVDTNELNYLKNIQ